MIPTAEDYLKRMLKLGMSSSEIMKGFAKRHVEAALKEASENVIIDTTLFFDFMFYCSPFKKSFKQFSSFSNSYLVNTVSLFSFSPIVCNICLLVSFKIFLYKGFCIADIYNSSTMSSYFWLYLSIGSSCQ